MSVPGSLTLGTAGHIDHGKTALVCALTGVDTDRLPQERARGISIELGYARLELPSGRILSLVDVPGHERFVRTMIAGASGIDLALLAVACDDGVMPQTREHVAILALLGISQVVVALTKRDLVDQDGADLARAEVEELLDPTPFATAAAVEVSARTGEGLDDLRAALEAAAAAVVPRPTAAPTRLPIDRVFSLRGIGTVVTGTLWSGSLGEGDRVVIEPRGLEARIRSVEVHDVPVAVAHAGRRVALNLVGVERAEVTRGDLIVAPASYPASYRLDVTLTALAGGPGIAHGELVQVLIGTAVIEGRVVLLGVPRLAAGETALAQLRLRSRATAARGDRAILRSTAPPSTVAGAIVLDPAPRRHGSSAAALERLALLAEGDPAALVRAALAAARWPATAGELAAPGVIGLATAAPALAQLATDGEILAFAGTETRYLARARYRELASSISEVLAMRVLERPLEPEMPLVSLVPHGNEALAELLATDGVIERDGPAVRQPGSGERGSSLHAAESASVIEALRLGGFTPPDLPTVERRLGLSHADFRSLCSALEREGSIVRFGVDLAYTAESYAKALAQVVELCEQQGEVTLAQVRDRLGASRRIVQALLEHLDGAGVTRRVGDRRVLRRRGADSR